jgi:uncharacterized protein (DUF58 family)
MSLFESDFLTKLEYLSLVSKQVFRGDMMAQRRTRRLGSGIEFADHRQYSTGDDFRYLDWNLYARHGELLLKRFHEEEDLHVYILLDASRSMQIGQPAKFDLARQVAAALAYLALSNLDRVAVCAFTDRVVHELPLTRGKARIHPVMQFLSELGCEGTSSSLADTASDFANGTRRRGLVIVISDLFDPAGFQTGLNLLRHQGFEVSLVQIYDDQDRDPGMLGDVELTDVESNTIRKMTITEQQLRRYRRAFDEFLNSVRRYCTENEMSLTVTSTQQTFDTVVQNMMQPEGVTQS